MTRRAQADRRRTRRLVLAAASAVVLVGVLLGVAELRAERAVDPSFAPAARASTLTAQTRSQERSRAADRAEVAVLAAERREHLRTTEAAAHATAVAQALADATAQAAATTAAAEAEAAEAQAAAAQRASASPATPATPAPSLFITSTPTADGDGSNGHLPSSVMCLIPWGTDQVGALQYLRCDAAAALTAMNDAFRAHFGTPVDMDLTYRSYADQVVIREYYGARAAAPGTSRHGLGTALDVQEWPDVYGFDTPRYAWLVATGPDFGWSAPASVRADAPFPEYWHFEYSP